MKVWNISRASRAWVNDRRAVVWDTTLNPDTRRLLPVVLGAMTLVRLRL